MTDLSTAPGALPASAYRPDEPVVCHFNGEERWGYVSGDDRDAHHVAPDEVLVRWAHPDHDCEKCVQRGHRVLAWRLRLWPPALQMFRAAEEARSRAIAADWRHA